MDQNGNIIPTDLIVLECNWLQLLTAAEAKAIDSLRWYEKVNPKHLHRHSPPMVSLAQLKTAVPTFVIDTCTLADLGIDFDGRIQYIDPQLHRYNCRDGWYHA